MLKKSAIANVLLINIFFLILCFTFGKPVFGAMDDYFMARVLEGVYGSDYNVHMTFVNALYGYALLPLYYLFPKIGWYYIGEITAVFVSFCVISFVIIKNSGVAWGRLLAILFVAAFASDYYLSVQFTQCASILSASGMLLVAYLASDKPQNKKLLYVLLAVLLLMWGSVMRWDAFLMGMPFFAFIILVSIKEARENKKIVLACLAMIFLGAIALKYFDRAQYEAPEYKKYAEFQAPRSLFGDGRNYNDQAVYEDLEELGYSGQDFAMFKDWMFYDSKVFSNDSIAPIISTVQRHYNSFDYYGLPGSFLGVLAGATSKPCFWIWAALCVFVFLSNRKKFPLAVSSLLPVFFVATYLLMLNRLVYRVENGMWLYATICVVPFLKDYELPKFTNALCVAATAIVACLNIAIYCDSGKQIRDANDASFVNLTEKKDTLDYKSFLNFTNSVSGNSLFLLPMQPYMHLTRYKNPAYLSEPFGNWSKIVSFGYWTPFFPDVEHTIQAKGVWNPMEDLVKENVFVVQDGGLKYYLQRHYYDSVNVELVRDFNGLKVYKYSLPSNAEAK